MKGLSRNKLKENERKRHVSDKVWAEKARQCNESELIRHWNEFERFENERKRHERNHTKNDWFWYKNEKNRIENEFKHLEKERERLDRYAPSSPGSQGGYGPTNLSGQAPANTSNNASGYANMVLHLLAVKVDILLTTMLVVDSLPTMQVVVTLHPTWVEHLLLTWVHGAPPNSGYNDYPGNMGGVPFN